MSFAILARLGLDTKDYENGLKRATSDTHSVTSKISSVFTKLGLSIAAIFSVRTFRSIATFAEELQNVDSATSKAAGSLRNLATEDDIGRVAKMSEGLRKLGHTLKIMAISDIAAIDRGLRKAFDFDSEAQAIEQLKAELQLPSDFQKKPLTGGTLFGTGWINDLLKLNTQEQIAEYRRSRALIAERTAAIQKTNFAKEELMTEETRRALGEKRIADEKRLNEIQSMRNKMAERELDVQLRIKQAVIDRASKEQDIAEIRARGAEKRQDILEDAATKLLSKYDRGRVSFDTILGDRRRAPRIPSAARSMAREVNRLEVQAQEAALFGDNNRSKSLIDQADALRNKIPGMQTKDQMIARTSMEKLVSIDRRFEMLAAKVGVAK